MGAEEDWSCDSMFKRDGRVGLVGVVSLLADNKLLVLEGKVLPRLDTTTRS